LPVHALDSDAPASVFAFLDQAVSARGREHWLWKYRIGSNQPTAFYWQDDDGAVSGFIGLMRTTLQTEGSEHPAAWFVDWHVVPGAQSVGVGMGLLRKAEAAAGMLLTLQGSADTREILPRLGWKPSSAPSNWVLPLTSRFVSSWIAQRAGSWSRGIARVLAAATSPFYLRAVQAAPLEGVEVVDVDRFPADYDRVWKTRSREFAPSMRRDSDYLNYLCADFPDAGYRLQLLELHGKTAGHLITRIDPDRNGLQRGRIVDIVWPKARPELASWLLRSACRQLRASGADYAECVASQAELQEALSACRFRRRKIVPIWYHRLGDAVPDPDTWHITFLDCDRAYR
jgi:hypothetical protein